MSNFWRARKWQDSIFERQAEATVQVCLWKKEWHNFLCWAKNLVFTVFFLTLHHYKGCLSLPNYFKKQWRHWLQVEILFTILLRHIAFACGFVGICSFEAELCDFIEAFQQQQGPHQAWSFRGIWNRLCICEPSRGCIPRSYAAPRFFLRSGPISWVKARDHFFRK